MPQKKKKTKNAAPDPIQAELDSIKRLLTLLLIKSGAKQEEIALALGIDQGDVSRMIPARKVKKFSFAQKE